MTWNVRTTLIPCCLLFLLSPQLVAAHGTIEQRISAVSGKLAIDPKNIELHLLRGELYASHEQWSAAEADFKAVADLDAANPDLHLYLGRMFLASNRPIKAEHEMKRYIEYRADDSRARITLAQILVRLDRPVEAADEYTLGINSHPRPSPDWYIQRAQALSGKNEEHLEEALRGLDQGMERIGPLATMQLYAVSLELRRNDYDAALARLDRVAEQSLRKETWLQRRAEILRQAGRDNEALEASAKALAALYSLSAHQRNTSAMRELESRILAFSQYPG